MTAPRAALTTLAVLAAALSRAGAQEPAGDAGWGQSDAASDAAGFEAPAPAPPPESAETGTEPVETAPPESGALEASGSARQRAALWAERMQGEPFAQARQSVDLELRYKRPFALGEDRLLLRVLAEGHLEYDFAYLHARDRFDEPTLDAYEFQVIGRETYAALSWDALELTFGRQIVAWGQGEIVSPVDIVNPRDLREPGLAELDDVRMAVLASRAGLFVAEHRFELMIAHESFFGLRPAPLSDFSPLRQLLHDDPQASAVLAGKTLRYHDVPDRFVNGAGQLYARWAYAGQGLDLALYAASTLDKQGVPRLPSAAELARPELQLQLWHPRYTMFGHAGAKPVGDFVLRWELGLSVDRPLGVREDSAPTITLDFVRREQLDALLAATYTGLRDTQLSLEYAQSLVLDNPDRAAASRVSLLGPVERPVFALRAQRSVLRERLTLTLVSMLLGVDPFVALFARAEASYELRDALHLGLGYALYAPSTDEFGPFYGFTDHDRLYATLRWDFMLD